MMLSTVAQPCVARRRTATNGRSAKATRAWVGNAAEVGNIDDDVIADYGYKLIYFDARGAAEPIRLLFAAAETEYEDSRYGVEFKDGAPSAPGFYEDKSQGKFIANLNRLPIMEVDGVKVGQTKAIERFLARRFDMMGSNDLEEAAIDGPFPLSFLLASGGCDGS